MAEQKIGFGRGLETKISNGYDRLVNSYVKVGVSGGTRIGYLENYAPTDLYLRPSLVDEGLSDLVVRRIESEKPMIIPISSVICVSPIREEYLKEIFENIKKINKEAKEKTKREKLANKLQELEMKQKIEGLKNKR